MSIDLKEPPPRQLREWWGSQALVRRSRVGPTTFYEVGYRRRGGFQLMGRAASLDAALEKARRRVERVAPRAAPRPAPLSRPVGNHSFVVTAHCVQQFTKRYGFVLHEYDAKALIRPSLLEPLGWNYDDMAEGEALTFLEETEWLRELPRMGPTGVAGAAFGARDQFNLVAHREALKRCRERRRRGSAG